MQTSDFHFDLPEHLIAQKPAPERGADRLLVLDRATGALEDRDFAEFPSLVEPGTLGRCAAVWEPVVHLSCWHCRYL